MEGNGIGLFDLAERRLRWINQRQGLLAENIANANTPNYQAKDLVPFAQTLAAATPGMTVTNPKHYSGQSSSGVSGWQQRPSERAVDGNAVSVEEQLTKVADTDGAQALVTTLYRKYIGLFHTVLGK